MLRKYARQRENWKREDAKSDIRNQEELFIRVKAFNGGEGGKTPLIPIGKPHMHGHRSQTVRWFANRQAIITDGLDSLAQCFF